MAFEHPKCHTVGVDVHTALHDIMERAGKNLGCRNHPVNIEFHNMGSKEGKHAITIEKPENIDRRFLINDSFDFCYTWCVFEHVDITVIDETLKDINWTLRPGGVFYLKINPLFFSSRGAHLYTYLSEP